MQTDVKCNIIMYMVEKAKSFVEYNLNDNYACMFCIICFSYVYQYTFFQRLMGVVGWCDVLGQLPVPGRPTILNTVGQGPIAHAAGAGGGWLGHFYSHLSFFLFLPLLGRRPDIN